MAHLGFGKSGGKFGGAQGGGSGDSVGEEVAHARARFAVDPSTPARLADAWKAPTGTTEEDESELIDAVADCLSGGGPLDAAVASWRSGALQVSAQDDGDDGDEDETDLFGEEETTVFDPNQPIRRRRIVEP